MFSRLFLIFSIFVALNPNVFAENTVGTTRFESPNFVIRVDLPKDQCRVKDGNIWSTSGECWTNAIDTSEIRADGQVTITTYRSGPSVCNFDGKIVSMDSANNAFLAKSNSILACEVKGYFYDNRDFVRYFDNGKCGPSCSNHLGALYDVILEKK